MQGVQDMTAREDLVVYLRHLLLKQLATDLHCSKIIRGDCAGTVAMRVLAEAAKVRASQSVQGTRTDMALIECSP